MSINLLSGRAFGDADNEQGQDVAILSQSMARKFWPNQDPLGRTFEMASDKGHRMEVVGVAQDVEFQIFGGAKQAPYFYIPYLQHSKGNTLMTFQLRSNRDLPSLMPAVEKTVHGLAPQL